MVRAILCATIQTCTAYTTIITTIAICSLIFAAYNLYASAWSLYDISYDYSLFYSQLFVALTFIRSDLQTGNLA